MSQVVKIRAYSIARSAGKAAVTTGHTAGALVLTLAGALAADPELAESLRQVFVEHPGALAALGGLVFLGRFVQDWRKHRQ